MEQTTDKSELISLEDLRGALAEFVATLLFVFMGVGAVVASGSLVGGDLTPARLVVIAMGHGLAIALLVFAIGHISGGYINPAVTFAAVVTRKISVPKGIVFVVAQLSGALIGAVLVSWVVPDAIEGTLGAHGLAPGVSAGMGVVIELVLTFLLVFVVFATAIDPRGGAGNLAPLAIGCWWALWRRARSPGRRSILPGLSGRRSWRWSGPTTGSTGWVRWRAPRWPDWSTSSPS